MSEVVVFHSALGLRQGVKDFAEQIRKAGHTVTTLDLYDGEIFDNYEAGGRKWDELGIPKIMQMAQAFCADLAGDIVFAGFSRGAALAELMAATHPGAKGCLLMHGALPPEMLQLKTWPTNVPVQLHYNAHDPFRNPEHDVALENAVTSGGSPFNEYLYEGNTHLFSDKDMPDYNESAAQLMTERAVRFVNEALS